MNKNFRLRYLLLSLISGVAINGFAQVTGDFRTKVTGNWSNYTSWDVYNGTAWIPATVGQMPTASANVFVQAGHTINVDNANEVCNDLNIDNSAGNGKVAFIFSSSVLNINGNFILSATANCFGTWISGAKIVFSGVNDQGFTGTGGLSVNSVFVNIEVNKPAGKTLTTPDSKNFRFGSFTLTSGDFTVGYQSEIQGTSSGATININGGVWTQTNSTTKIFSIPTASPLAIGTLNINGGSMILATTNASIGFMFSAISVSNGGTLTLNNCSGNISIGTSINMDASSTFNTALITTALPAPSSVTFNGIVNYNYAGAQDVSQATYSYLKLSGTGVKTIKTGTTVTIPANGTLEVSGTGPATLVQNGTLTISNSGTNLLYTSTGSQTATTNEWDPNFQNITINNSAGVGMAGLSRTIIGSLNLTNGTLNIGAAGTLTLDGAPLNRTNGYITGTLTSDFNLIGTLGGTVLLPLPSSTNISLRNITVSGTRKLAMDGLNNINLYGAFTIAANAAYDNGGESQIISGGGSSSISISGKFLNKDKDNFTGTNGAIPGIIPLLNPGCTIEYGLGGNQVVTARSDYQNIIFSGSGTKSINSTFAPSATVYITASASVDATNTTFGGISTNLNMNGGRLIMSGGSNNDYPGMQGIYNLTGGVIQFNNTNNSTTQYIRGHNISNSIISYFAIEVTGTNVTAGANDITLQTNGSFTVKNGGIFTITNNKTINAITEDGTQTVIVENGGTFECGSNQGFNGHAESFGAWSSIDKTINNVSLQAGSTVEYIYAGDQPITNANGLMYSNLNLAGSGTKTAPSGILTIKGNLTKSGTSTFAHNGGTVLLNGTTQSFAGFTYNNLILTNGTKTTSGSSTIIDSIKINDGTNLSISNGDVITLHSDATKTARVGQIGTGTITYNATGKFLVERYIPSKRAWRFLSVPTSSSTQTIKQAWQEGATLSSSDPKSGYGTQITSDRATWSADGFDALSFGPSVKTYNPGSDTYTGIASTNSSFDPTKGGYMTFIRGDRSATTVGSTVTSTTLRTAGTLFTGDQAPINLITGQFIPVNNPYASALDLRNISRSNSIFYYVWDPNRGGSYGFGGFITLSWDGSDDYDVVPANAGSYGTTNNYIASGQAFFVSGTGGPVQITENAKTPATVATIPFTPVGIPSQKLRSNLYSVNAYGNTFLADGVLISFGDNYSNNVDGMDAKKIMNASENLSLKREGVDLAIERRNTLLAKDTIFFNLSSLHKQQYRFEFIPSQLSQTGFEAYLEDSYLKTRTRLNLNDTALTHFVIDNNPASAAPGRFRIVFDAAGGVLPVTFTNVKAYPENENISVQWNVENEAGLKNYEVEKSPDGTRFTPAVVILANNNPVSSSYKWIDEQPVAAYNYYRVKSTGTTGEIQFSKTVRVWTDNCKKGIAVFPNPSGNGIIHLQFNNQPQGKYRLRLMNNSGQVIQSAIMQRTIRSSSTETIPLGKNIAHGLYRLHIVRPDNTELDVDIIY